MFAPALKTCVQDGDDCESGSGARAARESPCEPLVVGALLAPGVTELLSYELRCVEKRAWSATVSQRAAQYRERFHSQRGAHPTRPPAFPARPQAHQESGAWPPPSRHRCGVWL